MFWIYLSSVKVSYRFFSTYLGRKLPNIEIRLDMRHDIKTKKNFTGHFVTTFSMGVKIAPTAKFVRTVNHGVCSDVMKPARASQLLNFFGRCIKM